MHARPTHSYLGIQPDQVTGAQYQPLACQKALARAAVP
jgi:hypothetical protein